MQVPQLLLYHVVIWDSIVVEYDQELLLLLLIEATKLLMHVSVEENEDL
jgi:hypothetical protein